MPPDVSVIPPYHDEPAELLRECLQSLLAQRFAEWEGIVVDDASTAGHAREVVAALGDSRLHILSHAENRGLAATRSTGIRAAAAPLIALLDADDRLHPEFLEATTHTLEEHPDADWAIVDWEVFGAGTRCGRSRSMTR